MNERKWYTVNKDLLPIKTHYFFLYGGMAGTVAFMPTYAKEMGFHATAVGFIYTLLPFCIFVSKFFFGYITDFFRNIKLIMLVLAVVTTTAFMLILLIPPVGVAVQNRTTIRAVCANFSDKLILKGDEITSAPSHRCSILNARCYVTSVKCFPDPQSTLVTGILSKDDLNITISDSSLYLCTFPNSTNINHTECNCFQSKLSYNACLPITSSGATAKPADHSVNIYRSYNFWLFLMLSVISGSCAAASFSLIDAACYEVLAKHDQPKQYGCQRLWGTISWGIVALLVGFLNDLATADSSRTDYSPGFYIMLVFLVIDLLILYKLQLVKAKVSLSICKDIGKIFSSYKTMAFSGAVYISGAMTGLLWNYQFWYLQDLGASQTLLGLVATVQCLATEVPFFFFSGWIITKLGHFYCLVGVFLGFSLRFGLYSALRYPWVVIPIELLHGITFALSYACMTDYAAGEALAGTEVTTMSALEGVFEGLGVATGSLLGGIGFDQLGGRMTFFVAGMMSFICAPGIALLYTLVNRYPEESRFKSLKSLNGNRNAYGANECCKMDEKK